MSKCTEIKKMTFTATNKIVVCDDIPNLLKSLKFILMLAKRILGGGGGDYPKWETHWILLIQVKPCSINTCCWANFCTAAQYMKNCGRLNVSKRRDIENFHLGHLVEIL